LLPLAQCAGANVGLGKGYRSEIRAQHVGNSREETNINIMGSMNFYAYNK
jgi:hypothetical protein